MMHTGIAAPEAGCRLLIVILIRLLIVILIRLLTLLLIRLLTRSIQTTFKTMLGV